MIFVMNCGSRQAQRIPMRGRILPLYTLPIMAVLDSESLKMFYSPLISEAGLRK